MTPPPAPPTILVVDDTPANLELLDSMLSQRGYRVLSFTRADLALRAAARSVPDLVLLDVNMPVLNGYEACARLKADAALRDVPVIFVSAMTTTQDKIKAFEAGGVDYVTKPFQIEEVQARIDTHLRLRSLQRDLAHSYAELKRVEDLKDNLVGMVVHDMRTPLTSITGNLELALLGLPEVPTQTQQHVRSAHGSARVLCDMIDALLDVTRMESGDFPLCLESGDLVSIVRDGTALATDPNRRVTVTLDLPEALPPLRCDRDIVRRVVSNLVSNAVKYVPEGGTVVVSCTAGPGPDELGVVVADTGPGIPPEYHAHIFDKFAQVLGRQHGYKRSTGLGLTFCKLAVEAHGGRIGVESQPGQGSTFWFTLPLQPPSQPGPPPGVRP